MRFQMNEVYAAKNTPNRTAVVLQLDDDGRKAWVQVNDSGAPFGAGDWVTYAQFVNAWELQSFEYEFVYRITVVHEDGGFIAYTERMDGTIIRAGLSMGVSVGTNHYAARNAAIVAAKSAIDSGEVK